MSEDLKAQLGAAAARLSTKDLAAAIASSKHGGSTPDPLAVAALIKSWG